MQTSQQTLLEVESHLVHLTRSPLSNILGLCQLLEDPDNHPALQGELLQKLSQTINRLDEILAKALDIMRYMDSLQWTEVALPAFVQNTVAHFNQQFNTKIKLHFDLMPQWNIDSYLLKCVLEDFCAYTYLAIRKNSFQEPEIWLKMDESAQGYQLRAKLRGNLLDWEDWNQKQELFINAAFPSPERNWTLSNAAKYWQTKWEISGEDEEYTWFALDILKKIA